MNFDAFVQLLRERLQVGLVLANPGGGTSTVVECSDTQLRYGRGESTFRISIRDLYQAYQHFVGGPVTTNDLATYAPAVFDQGHGGHNCHRTLSLMVLLQMGLVGPIWGSGRPGDPFGVSIPALEMSS